MYQNIFTWLILYVNVIESRNLRYSISEKNNFPVIGIVAHPISEVAIKEKNNDIEVSEYIASSYVKWIESAGAQVIPIPYNATRSTIDFLLDRLNGILLPGGEATINENIKYLFYKAKKLNDENNYFPIWATCLGYEWMLQFIADDDTILDSGFDAENISLPLYFLQQNMENSRIFHNAPYTIINYLSDLPIMMNNHVNGIESKHFYDNSKLSSFFRVLAINKDRQNRESISIIEGRKYPFYGVQFHPEKSIFEWGIVHDNNKNNMYHPFEVIDHSFPAVISSQYFVNFFLMEARKNENHFSDYNNLKDSLIYNYPTSMMTWPGFTESYLFSNSSYPNYM